MNNQDVLNNEKYKAIEKRYAKDPRKKRLLVKAQRDIFRRDLLQRNQREFREVYRRQYKLIEETDRVNEKLRKDKEAEMDKIYRERGTKSLTLKQKILKDLRDEHHSLVSEEDILKCQY